MGYTPKNICEFIKPFKASILFAAVALIICSEYAVQAQQRSHNLQESSLNQAHLKNTLLLNSHGEFSNYSSITLSNNGSDELAGMPDYKRKRPTNHMVKTKIHNKKVLAPGKIRWEIYPKRLTKAKQNLIMNGFQGGNWGIKKSNTTQAPYSTKPKFQIG